MESKDPGTQSRLGGLGREDRSLGLTRERTQTAESSSQASRILTKEERLASARNVKLPRERGNREGRESIWLGPLLSIGYIASIIQQCYNSWQYVQNVRGSLRNDVFQYKCPTGFLAKKDAHEP